MLLAAKGQRRYREADRSICAQTSTVSKQLIAYFHFINILNVSEYIESMELRKRLLMSVLY